MMGCMNANFGWSDVRVSTNCVCVFRPGFSLLQALRTLYRAQGQQHEMFCSLIFAKLTQKPSKCCLQRVYPTVGQVIFAAK